MEPHGELCTGLKWGKLAGQFVCNRQKVRGIHGGATLEILKVVLAQRGFGLSRIPAMLMTEIGKAVTQA